MPDDAELTRLAGEVAELRELVRQRVLDDEARRELYDELYRQLRFAQQDLADQFVAPVLREILLVVDRIDAMAAHLPAASAEVLGTVREELSEVLVRRGVREVGAADAEFDPRTHEAVARVPVTTSERVGRVVEVRRPGYALEARLLRPAQVAVGHLAERESGRDS